MPVTREELVRYRRLWELAQAQKDAVLAGRFVDLPKILAERQSLLNDRFATGYAPRFATGCAPAGVSVARGGAAAGDAAAVSTAAAGEAGGVGEDAVELVDEARELLRAVLEVDRECHRLVLERLRQVEGDLEATRTALHGSQAYRLSLEASRGSRILDELK